LFGSSQGRREDKVVVEVGFGGGECLQEMVCRYEDYHQRGLKSSSSSRNKNKEPSSLLPSPPSSSSLLGVEEEVYFLGIEWHRGSLRNVMERFQSHGITSGSRVRIMQADILRLLSDKLLAPTTIDEVYILFPDPWPKKNDWPRRVINPVTIRQLKEVVREGGYLHVATDVKEYAEWVGKVVEEDGGWVAAGMEGAGECIMARTYRGGVVVVGEEEEEEEGRENKGEVVTRFTTRGIIGGRISGGDGDMEEKEGIYGLLPHRPPWRPVTAYERRGVMELGRAIYDLCYVRRQKREEEEEETK